MSNHGGPVTTFELALGREVRGQRARLNLGQSDIVDLEHGLSLSSVQRIEKGEGATTRQLLGLAATFGMGLPEFMAKVEEEAKRPPPPPRKRRHRIPPGARVTEGETYLAHEDEPENHAADGDESQSGNDSPKGG